MNRNYVGRSNAEIGIVLATYRPRIDFLKQQLNSIRQQTIRNWFCVITDDASPREFIEEITNCIKDDERFFLLTNEEQVGPYFNFERGLRFLLENQNVDLIAFSDQDDLWFEKKLEIQKKALSKSKFSLVHSDLIIIDSNGDILSESCWKHEKRNVKLNRPEDLVLRNVVTGCSMMIKRQLALKALPFPKQRIPPVFHHDTWIALVSSFEDGVRSIHNPLLAYRQHDHNVVGPANYGPVTRSLLQIEDIKAFLRSCLHCYLTAFVLISTAIEHTQNFRNFGIFSSNFIPSAVSFPRLLLYSALNPVQGRYYVKAIIGCICFFLIKNLLGKNEVEKRIAFTKEVIFPQIHRSQ